MRNSFLVTTVKTNGEIKRGERKTLNNGKKIRSREMNVRH
ncbi:unnamed protein product [Arabidopsis halleri]